MSFLSVVFFFLFALSVRGEDEVCQDEGVKFRKCERGNVLTRVTDDGSTAGLFPGLRHVSLEFSDDIDIAPNAFSAVDLTSLWITLPYPSDRNGLPLSKLTLHPDSFAGLPNLTELHMNNANIEFGGNPLAKVPTLTQLELRTGELTEIPETIIKSLPNLETLSLETNKISRIPGNIFENQKHLKALNLGSNQIRRLEPGWSNKLDQLEELNLMGNTIASEPDMFAGLPNVKTLLISEAFDYNGFQKDMIRNLSQLTSLSIGYNKIRSLDPGMFDNSPQLSDISLYSNLLTRVPTGVFESLRSLKKLTFAENKIETIEPGAFSGLNLTTLGLHINRIKTIEPRTFDGVEVRRLNLNHNQISELKPHAFDGLTANSVDLTDNKLTKIEADDFAGLTTEDLDLSGNDIKTIAPGAFRNTKLKVLGLFRTPIKTVKRREWGLSESVEIMM